MRFIGRWLVTFIATIVTVNVVPGIFAVGGQWVGPLACALVLSLVNASIKPVLQVIGLPITIVTLGIFYLVINAALLEFSSWLSRAVLGVGIYIDGFGAALLGAIVISIVSMILSSVMGTD